MSAQQHQLFNGLSTYSPGQGIPLYGRRRENIDTFSNHMKHIDVNLTDTQNSKTLTIDGK